MEIKLKDVATNKLINALILPVTEKDIALNKDGWNFNWVQLFKSKGGMCFKLVLEVSPNIIEGFLMLSIMNNEMVYINNLESAQHNIGSGKKFDYVAGCLLAYTCKLSLKLGKKGYRGFVSFDSKTKLIPLYQSKYGASYVGGVKMFFTPESGAKLINQYLKGIQ